MAQLSQAPPEHVDVDRGPCEESGAKGQFSEHSQGETHVPTIAEEPNFDGPWGAGFIQKQGMAITMIWRE
jgi:hypothetical protein